MTETCTKCGLEWIISEKTKIPKTGYECPHCAHKRRNGIPITWLAERKERTDNASSDK